MRSITLSRPTLGKAGHPTRAGATAAAVPLSVRQPIGEAMRRLGCLLPLVLIVALAVPAGASAHKLRLDTLVDKVDQVAQARVDASQGYWSSHKIHERSCRLSRGNRLHRHVGRCDVRFYRDDSGEHPCEYEIRVRYKSRSYRFVAPKYEDLQPKDYTCPARP